MEGAAFEELLFQRCCFNVSIGDLGGANFGDLWTVCEELLLELWGDLSTGETMVSSCLVETSLKKVKGK